MYNGFANKRAFHNAKIHGLAALINPSGARELVEDRVSAMLNMRVTYPTVGMLPNPDGCSVRQLTDAEAEKLYRELLEACRFVKANMKTTKEILKLDGDAMTGKQRNKIIRITKYKFKWSADVTFSKIVEWVPKLTKRLTPWQIKNTKLIPLFNQMTNEHADLVIKRLEKVEERNKQNENK